MMLLFLSEEKSQHHRRPVVFGSAAPWRCSGNRKGCFLVVMLVVALVSSCNTLLFGMHAVAAAALVCLCDTEKFDCPACLVGVSRNPILRIGL